MVCFFLSSSGRRKTAIKTKKKIIAKNHRAAADYDEGMRWWKWSQWGCVMGSSQSLDFFPSLVFPAGAAALKRYIKTNVADLQSRRDGCCVDRCSWGFFDTFFVTQRFSCDRRRNFFLMVFRCGARARKRAQVHDARIPETVIPMNDPKMSHRFFQKKKKCF